jgi:hypothetical protein
MGGKSKCSKTPDKTIVLSVKNGYDADKVTDMFNSRGAEAYYPLGHDHESHVCIHACRAHSGCLNNLHGIIQKNSAINRGWISQSFDPLHVELRDKIPVDVDGCNKSDFIIYLEYFGMVFGDIVEDNNSLQYVKLPNKWYIDHKFENPMLVDDKGQYRAKLLLNQDRPQIKMLTKYNVYNHSSDCYAEYVVADSNSNIIYRSPHFEFSECCSGDDLKMAEAKEDATNWVSGKYPDWQNIEAYWQLS